MLLLIDAHSGPCSSTRTFGIDSKPIPDRNRSRHCPGDNPQVFKLDTVTGKTWEVAFAMQGTAKTVVWGVVADLPESRK